LVKLECFEIILFNALAFFIHKKNDFKAVKFFQKACDLNDGSGCSLLGFMYDRGKESNHCYQLNHTPFGKT
jgi:TPR repeat protein